MTDATNEKRFDKIDAQLNKMDEQLHLITKAVVKGFDRIDKTLETKADAVDLQKALGLLDSFAKRQEISDDERLVMGHQLTRLHDWVEEAAKRIDLKFVH
jgi:hypothetical protein